ncbi:MAG: hypothetical protein WBX22_01560 [Silvibacterium sp.]
MDQAVSSDYEVRPPSSVWRGASGDDGDYEVRPPDFTTNTQNEGLYRMLPQHQQGYTDTSEEISVPFSKIKNAQNAGYNLHPDEVPRYAKDVRYQGEGPTWYERVDQHIQKALRPEIPSRAPAKDLLELGDRQEQAFRNTARAAGRVAYGMPGYVKQLANAAMESQRTGNPNQLLDLIDPMQIPKGLLQQYQEDRKTDTGLAIQNLIGGLLGTAMTGRIIGEAAEAPGKAVRSLPELRRMAEDRFVAPRVAPRTVDIGGVTVPATIGEAEPESYWGRKQTELKRRGVKAPQFTRLENEQQQAVKEVIRKTAQQTSGLIGPVQDEPADAMKDAAEITFQQAKPMYEALDQSLQTVPASFKGVSQIVKQAMTRAGKLGANVGGEGPVDISKIVPEPDGTIQWGGTRISKATHPERWAQLVQDGIINDTGQGTPLAAAMGLRSALLKMQRSSADPAYRNAIAAEVRTINDAVDATLRGTPLYDNWIEANRLWSKGYALRKVASEIRAASKGTPQAAQAPGVAPVPTRLQGGSLVRRLNTLAKNGVLDRGFTPQEVANLRQSADILDRIGRTPTGKGGGETVPHSRGLAHALAGATGPAIGAGAGAAAGALGGGVWGALGGATTGATLGLLLQGMSERALVDVMTRTEGVRALQAVGAARTPAQLQTAMTKLATAAAASSAARQPKTLRELQAEAARRRPAGGQGVVTQYDVQTGSSASQ